MPNHYTYRRSTGFARGDVSGRNNVTSPTQGARDSMVPSRIRMVRPACPAACSSCVTSRRVPPSRWNPAKSPSTAAALTGSRLPVGSSASNSGGRLTSAGRWPPAAARRREFGRTVAQPWSELELFEQLDRPGASGRVLARQCGGRHVLQDGQVGQQMEHLEHEADLLPRNLARAAAEAAGRSSPATTTRPDVGEASPPANIKSVDLPHPLGPRTATNSPSPRRD